MSVRIWLLVALFAWCSSAQAAFLDLIPPADPDGDNGSGSLGSPPGFDRSVGPAGLVFNADRDFTITAVSIALAIEGNVQVSASIRDESGSPLLQTTQVISNSRDRFLPTNRINPSDSFDWLWFDIPLAFSFAVGNRYQLVFPFSEYVLISGVFTRDQNDWLMIVPHFFDNEKRALSDPYPVQGVLTVLDGTLRGSRITGMPLAGMITTLTDIPEVDRTFRIQPVPVPSTVGLIGLGVACLAIRRRRYLRGQRWALTDRSTHTGKPSQRCGFASRLTRFLAGITKERTVVSSSHLKIPEHIKRQVLIEAGYRCGVPTCRAILVLDLHHIVEIPSGCVNSTHNRLPVCRTCHALHHSGRISCESLEKPCLVRKSTSESLRC